MNGRTLHLKVDVVVAPKGECVTGTTDRAKDVGERLALELGMLAQRLAGEGYKVTVEPKIIIY